MTDFLARCDREVDETWAAVKRGPFWRHVVESGMDRDLYVGLMREIYHYTRHNSQNQALAALSVGSDRLSLLRFCLHHAYEEAGHDLMALNDLSAVGVDPQEVRDSKPLPETEAFVAWLYRIAEERDATARLGYSYWAEGCYGYIAEVLDAMRRDLGLGDRQMTFFVAHAQIDAGHFEEVREVATTFCTEAGRQEGMIEVLRTSLILTGGILDGVHREWTRGRRSNEPAGALLR